MVERPGLKPAWKGERRLPSSRKNETLLRIIFSKILEREEMSEIRRKEAAVVGGLPGFRIGIMRESFHLEGKVEVDQERLKIESRMERAEGGRCWRAG